MATSTLTEITCPKCSGICIRNEEINAFYGECPTCQFVFCTNCKNDFHGYTYDQCPSPPNLLYATTSTMIYLATLASIVDQVLCESLEFAVRAFFELKNSGDNKQVFLTDHHSEESIPSTTNIECEICLESTSIGNTTDLGCVHLHCNTCVKGYYESLIKEGKVHSLKCPSRNCEQSVEPSVLKQLIAPEVFALYDLKLLDEILQDEPEIVCCPRPGCGKRFQSQPEYGYCESCDYSFCTNCNQAYHGLSVCGESEEERLRQTKAEIAAATEEERIRLEEEEKRKRKMQDDSSHGFIKRVCKRCPNCRADIQKYTGCNHITCTKCGTHFCWLCLTIMKTGNPYNHFEKTGARCSLY